MNDAPRLSGHGERITRVMRWFAPARFGGFWLDGLDERLSDLPAMMHDVLPEAVVMVNNFTRFQVAGMETFMAWAARWRSRRPPGAT